MALLISIDALESVNTVERFRELLKGMNDTSMVVSIGVIVLGHSIVLSVVFAFNDTLKVTATTYDTPDALTVISTALPPRGNGCGAFTAIAAPPANNKDTMAYSAMASLFSSLLSIFPFASVARLHLIRLRGEGRFCFRLWVVRSSTSFGVVGSDHDSLCLLLEESETRPPRRLEKPSGKLGLTEPLYTETFTFPFPRQSYIIRAETGPERFVACGARNDRRGQTSEA